MTQNNELNR